MIVSAALYFVAGRRLKREQVLATTKWKQQVDTINPLDTEFTRKRINVMDLANPVTKIIPKKRFIDCELMGPANIVIISTSPGSGNFNRVRFSNCDIIVMNEKTPIFNVVMIQDPEVIGGNIFNLSIFVHPNMIPVFLSMGTFFASLTGSAEIDNRSPPGIG